jgi:hypothetical protein
MPMQQGSLLSVVSRMRPFLMFMMVIWPLVSLSQFMIGPEMTLLLQREPSPFAYGAGFRAAYAIGKKWSLTSSAGLTLPELEKVDGMFGSTRYLAAGVPPQYRKGENLHAHRYVMIAAEWRSLKRSKKRRGHFAAGLAAGHHQYRMRTDHQVTLLETGEQFRSQYILIDDAFILLPYAGWRTYVWKGEFFVDAGSMLHARRSFMRNSMPLLRTGLNWPLFNR